MRILNITAQRPDGTGSGTYLSELVTEEVALGHRAAVICGLPKDEVPTNLPMQALLLPVRFDTGEVPFHVCGMSDAMPYPATRYRDLTSAQLAVFEDAFTRAILEALETFRPDVVVCNHLYLVTALARELAPHLPVVAICHSTGLRQLAMHDMENDRIVRALRSLDSVFALHDVQAEQIVSQLGVDRDHVHVVGVGFNARIFNAGGGVDCVRRERGILYAGKVCRAKGVLSLLDVLDLMHRRGSDEGVSLYLAGGCATGDRDGDTILDRLARLPIEHGYLGRLGQEDLAQAYRSFGVCVLPSFFEGLPLTVVEALACGCKVVATDLPGVRRWLEGSVPHAPVVWVEPPRMTGVDTPLEADLPAFVRRLADALEEALAHVPEPCDVSGLSWGHVCKRLLGELPRERVAD